MLIGALIGATAPALSGGAWKKMAVISMLVGAVTRFARCSNERLMRAYGLRGVNRGRGEHQPFN